MFICVIQNIEIYEIYYILNNIGLIIMYLKYKIF